jgi:hypothetical protein
VIIIGHYLGKKSVTLEDGESVLQMRFSLEKEIGLDANELGLGEINVLYPNNRNDKIWYRAPLLNLG